jgi:hypothetical protein
MLLQQGIELAEKEGRKIYLESTAAGRPLYAKLGWKVVDVLSVDLKQFGGEGPGENWVMLRNPVTGAA